MAEKRCVICGDPVSNGRLCSSCEKEFAQQYAKALRAKAASLAAPIFTDERIFLRRDLEIAERDARIQVKKLEAASRRAYENENEKTKLLRRANNLIDRLTEALETERWLRKAEKVEREKMETALARACEDMSIHSCPRKFHRVEWPECDKCVVSGISYDAKRDITCWRKYYMKEDR